MRAQQPLQQVVAGDGGLVDLALGPQDQMQRYTQLRAGCGQLPAVVGLHGRAVDDGIGAALHPYRQAVLEHAGLVAAKSQPSEVVPFDIDLRPAEGGAEAGQMLQRRIHLAQANTRFRLASAISSLLSISEPMTNSPFELFDCRSVNSS